MNSPILTVSSANDFGWGPAISGLDPTKTDILDAYVLGPQVADLGCATGRYTAYIAAKGFQVVGIDHNRQFISLAKKKHPDVSFIVGDTLKLPLKNKSVDTVVAFDLPTPILRARPRIEPRSREATAGRRCDVLAAGGG